MLTHSICHGAVWNKGKTRHVWASTIMKTGRSLWTNRLWWRIGMLMVNVWLWPGAKINISEIDENWTIGLWQDVFYAKWIVEGLQEWHLLVEDNVKQVTILITALNTDMLWASCFSNFVWQHLDLSYFVRRQISVKINEKKDMHIFQSIFGWRCYITEIFSLQVEHDTNLILTFCSKH